jgi:AraC family transcriptional regulator
MIQGNIHRDLAAIKKVKKATRVEIYKRLQWALEFMDGHYQEQITVEDLASHACLSIFHFKRMFKEFFGETPYQYLKNIRLKKAADLLVRGMPVNEVCRSVGWEDASSFIRLFKKSMSVTPNQFRQLPCP